MSLVLWIFLRRMYLNEKNSFKIFLRFLDFPLILNVDVKKIQKIKAEKRKLNVIKTQSHYYSTLILTENTFFNLVVVVVLVLNCRERFVREMQELESKLYSFFNESNIELKVGKTAEKNSESQKTLAMWQRNQIRWRIKSQRSMPYNKKR